MHKLSIMKAQRNQNHVTRLDPDREEVEISSG